MSEINFEDYVYYDETSPTFLRWKVFIRSGRNNSGRILAFPESTAGSCGTDHGYSAIKIGYKKYGIHRVVWELLTGKTPIIIDHIDGNKSNNHILNLREVSQNTNAQNKAMQRNNNSGITGVYFTTNRGKLYVVSQASSRSRWFSVEKYGLLPAFAKATIERRKTIDLLNSEGCSYSARHGI